VIQQEIRLSMGKKKMKRETLLFSWAVFFNIMAQNAEETFFLA